MEEGGEEVSEEIVIDSSLTCWGCRFCDIGYFVPTEYQSIRNAETGLCRRRAPLPRELSHEAKWPVVNLVDPADWCGDYQRRDPDQEKQIQAIFDKE